MRSRKDKRLEYLVFPSGRTWRRDKIQRFSICNPKNPQNYHLIKELFNCSEEDLSDCIITYASYNSNFVQPLKRLINSLKRTGYKGHLLYRIGGWPNMEKGCLSHCHVPYGFKTCAFLEAKSLGYENVLWLDANIKVIRSLEPIFKWIQTHDCLYRYSYYPLKKGTNHLILNTFNLTKKDINKIPHVSTMVIGLNVKSQKIQNFLNDWHDLVVKEDSYFSCFVDQPPFSLLLSRYGLSTDGSFAKDLVKIRNESKKKCYFIGKK